MQDQRSQFDVIPEHKGTSYLQVLKSLHAALEPRTYLEIGTSTGTSLTQSACKSLAIDPKFEITTNVIGTKPSCLMMQMPSDRFFADYDAEQMLGGKIDFAFLDGMHWYEFLLRDFINVERHCRHNSVIAIHDCIPTDAYIARRDGSDQSLRDRSPRPGWWAGDVWKAIVILQKARPDLRIRGFDAPPTGLILITGLDPESRVLEENYFDLVEDMERVDAQDGALASFVASLPLLPCATIDSRSKISQWFWL
jgi:hypothetical protein